MSSAREYIEVRFPELTPLERAIMRATPERFWQFLRYSDLGSNETFLRKLSLEPLTTSDYELTDLIRKDKADEAIHRFLYMISYKDGKSVLSDSWCRLYIYIIINLCFVDKSRETLNAFIKHPFVRDLLDDMLNDTVYYKVSRGQNMFLYADVMHPMFDDMFFEDTLIMDKIKLNPEHERILYDSLVMATIRGRHYEGIDKLLQMNERLTRSSLSRILDSCKYPHEKEFVKLCLDGYSFHLYQRSMKEITDKTSGLPDELKQLTEIDCFTEEECLFLENAIICGLQREALSLLLNNHRDDPAGKIIQQTMHWTDLFSGICHMVEKMFSIQDQLVLSSAVDNDDSAAFMQLFTSSEDTTKSRVSAALLAAIRRNATNCVRSLKINPDTSAVLQAIMVSAPELDPEDTTDLYGAINYVRDEYLERFEALKYPHAAYAAADSSMVADLYVHTDIIDRIPSNSFNDFRYALMIGSIVHLNTDVYDWTIEHFYDGNPDNFIADMFIRTQRLKDEYSPVIHSFCRVFKAFMLYRKSIDYIAERDL